MFQTIPFLPHHDGQLWLHEFHGPNYDTHWHLSLELTFVIRGRAVYLANNQRYDLNQGSLMWLFPSHEHMLLEQSRDLQMWIYVFRPSLARRIAASTAPELTRRQPPGNCSVHLTEGEVLRLNELSLNILAASKDHARFNAGLSFALLEFWAAHLQSEVFVPTQRVHPSVERAARLINEEPAEYSSTALAKELGLSRSRLSQLFHAQMGITLVSYRQRCQIQHFLKLFKESPSRKLISLCLTAGFGSYPQFYRVFCKEMGHSPSDFLKHPPRAMQPGH